MTSSAPSAAVQAAPSYWTASRRIFELSLGEMLWSRRTIFMALVVGGPVVLAVVFRVVQLFGLPALRVNGVPVEGAAIFGVMIWMLFVRFIVPVLGVFYGTALMADEVEDKTITYLFTRPIPRGAVLVGKYLAYLACTVLVVLPSVMLVYFLVVPFGQIPATFGQLLADLGILAAGLAVYGALFAFIGAWLRRPVLIGLVFAFGWEPVAVAMPGYLEHFTVAYYLQALVPHAMPSDGAMSVLQSFFAQPPSLAVSLGSLGAYFVVFLILAARIVERKEYVLDQ